MSSFLTKFAPKPGTVGIACYHCGGRQEVGRQAQTVTCRHCHKPLQVSDVQVKRYDARREVRTVGMLVVEKKGQIVADRVECGGLVARGHVKAKHSTVVRGTALIGPSAQLDGGVEAFTVNVAEGASLSGYFCVGKDHMKAPPPPAIEEAEVFPDAAAIDAPAAGPAIQVTKAKAAPVAGLVS